MKNDSGPEQIWTASFTVVEEHVVVRWIATKAQHMDDKKKKKKKSGH